MSAKIIPMLQVQQRYSGSYEFNVTHTPDPDYRKYLARQLRGRLPAAIDETLPTEASALDISLDDMEGDVVAGLAAWTSRESMTVDMLWVGEPLRGQGIGRRLLQMAEEAAIKRGCIRARLSVTCDIAYFVGAGYRIVGTVQALDFRKNAANTTAQAVYWLEKEL